MYQLSTLVTHPMADYGLQQDVPLASREKFRQHIVSLGKDQNFKKNLAT